MDYILGPPVRVQNGGCLVRLADDARKCVVFFGTPSPGVADKLEPWGTGFLVATADTGTIYLVTARHVIQPYLDCPFAIRFNNKNGGSRNWPVDFAKWELHPNDKTTDVAIMEIEPPAWADWLPFPQTPGIMDDFKFETKNIGPGDIIYTVGLWKFFFGKKQNQPFVHVGHIGLIPEDDRIPIEVNWSHKDDGLALPKGRRVLAEVYLTEGEPLDGASGSPVFVRRSMGLGPGLYREDPNAKTWIYGTVWLLGLQHGAWFAKPGEDYQIPHVGKAKIPRGINVVVPSMKINETLNQPRLKAKRAAVQEALDRARSPTPTPLSAPNAVVDNPNHLADFTRLVDVAARKRPQGDQT